MADVETFKYGFLKATTLEVGPDGITDGDHFVPYAQIRSIDKGGGKWLGYDIELVWGNKGAWATGHSSGHEFNFGDDVESRDRAYELIVSRIAPTAQPQAEALDIPDQIKKLAELRDSGVLTPEEFVRMPRRSLAARSPFCGCGRAAGSYRRAWPKSRTPRL